MLEPVRVRLLGGFGVSVGRRIVGEDAWRLRKAATLVKLLALAEGHRLHREQVMGQLWPDLAPRAAHNNLRQVLHAARGALASDGSAAPLYLRVHDGWITLCPDGDLWVDVEAFEEAARTAGRVGEPAAYRAAIDLYAGELLPADRYAEWAEEKREALRQSYITLLVELAALYEERGEWEPAISALTSALETDLAHEEAHLGLMRLFAAAGRRGDAILQYQRLRRVLADELDAEPGEAGRLLYERIAAARSHEPPPSETRDPVTPAGGSPRHNLPAERTSFVGREGEVVEVERLLAMTRLMTLTGPGGAGKTRLALALARHLAGTYQDGAWMVGLAPLAEEELVAQAVADAVGVREEPGRPLAATLKEHLSSKELLLVVDNCEHLVEAVARMVETLLDSCERVRVLATSREALNVPGELTWQVPTLSVPGTTSPTTVESLTGYASVRLFVERARYRQPDFDLTPENVDPVAEICRALDGIPLALELAAARVGTLSPGQIAARLENALQLLVGSRTAPSRQRTLEGALDWSFELLSESERDLFGKLSVFAGGWTLEAAETVVAGSGLEKDEVLGVLLSLVEKSLVMAEASEEGGLRYRMLQPVRQYGGERLEENGSKHEVQHRHAAWFLTLAERAAPELRGPRQGTWIKCLEREHDDLRAAAAWFLDGARLEEVVRLGWALWLFWWVNAHLAEGRRWMEEALESGDSMLLTSRAKALFVAGTMADLQADRRAAEPMLEESLKIFRELGDRRGAGFALGSAGLVALGQERREEGISLLKEGADLFLEVGEKWGAAVLFIFAGAGRLRQDDLVRAGRLAERGLALSLEADYKPGASVARYLLARVAYASDDRDRATELFREGLELSAAIENDPVVAYCLEGLADIAASEDRGARAACLWGAAEAVLETVETTAEAAAYPYAPDHTTYESQASSLRGSTDEKTFAAAWSDGRAMTVEQAVEYALSEAEPKLDVPRLSSADRKRPQALTRREREIAELVARDLTNRQIAEVLSISEHTAATHVRSILKKLDLRSRTQIAARVEASKPLP